MSELTRKEIFDLLNRPRPLWLNEIDLSGAMLCGARLRGANLSKADLSGADLSGASLCEAYHSGVALIVLSSPGKFDPSKINLSEVKGANPSEFTLIVGANLSGANLSGANLSDAKLWGATMPDGTKHD